MSLKLDQANAFIPAHSSDVNPEFRPVYHLAAPVGWINDPNGFCYWRGQYHVFAQFHPYAAVWGPMHWAHWVSKDFAHWQWVSVAMAPDMPFDDLGCFSGTALAEDDRLLLMYTGVHHDENGRTVQEQCIAESTDGVNFVKYAGNPVLGCRDLPAGSDPSNFRDPKLMRTADGYRVILASRGADNGRQLSYSSEDLHTWHLDGVLLENIGDMPECPDYFSLDGSDVMITSVIHMPVEPLRFPTSQAVVYIAGQEKNGRLMADTMESVDMGVGFYAPESMCAPDGRRIMMGWLTMCGAQAPTQYLEHHWMGMMTIPRELSLHGGRLFQQPAREMQQLRGQETSLKHAQVRGEKAFSDVKGRVYELDVTLCHMVGQVEIRLLKSADGCFLITYDAETQRLVCDRSRLKYPVGSPDADEHAVAAARVPLRSGALRLHIFVDKCSVEVFAGAGEAVISLLAYPAADAEKITFRGNMEIETLSFWELNGIGG